jgi:hypothetical protein
VKEFNYFGILLTKMGNFKRAIKTLVGKGTKANILYTLCTGRLIGDLMGTIGQLFPLTNKTDGASVEQVQQQHHFISKLYRFTLGKLFNNTASVLCSFCVFVFT